MVRKSSKILTENFMVSANPKSIHVFRSRMLYSFLTRKSKDGECSKVGVHRIPLVEANKEIHLL
jgi:hypothetical protein